MAKRFAAIWLRHLKTDWFTIKNPEVKNQCFVLSIPDKGRKIVSACSFIAEQQGIRNRMSVADAKALIPDLKVVEDDTDITLVLKDLAKRSIRFTPLVFIDPPDGLVLDISGCAHLWGGEEKYSNTIISLFHKSGFHIQIAIADTIGAAWAVSRYGQSLRIIPPSEQLKALLPLPPAALRLAEDTIIRFNKLGLSSINSIISMPRSALRRRFGEHTVLRLAQALGVEHEYLIPVDHPVLYEERLPCLEPLRTATAISLAIRNLLEALCKRLFEDGKGLRKATLQYFRLDGKELSVQIGTNISTCKVEHLFQLFNLKISQIAPGLGIELFILKAYQIEDLNLSQEKIWSPVAALNSEKLLQLIDRIQGKTGKNTIKRYLPAEHYWPEYSFKEASSFHEQPETYWRMDKPRPITLLNNPELIEVTAPIPDYPPMSFRYKGISHTIVKADGPERIEPEWWRDKGEYRDYYHVEDEYGRRYWLYRLGAMQIAKKQWFVHGFFA